MTPDRATLEAELTKLQQDVPGLQSAVTEREQEIYKLTARLKELNEQVLRNQGALAYIELVIKRTRATLESLPPGPGAAKPVS